MNCRVYISLLTLFHVAPFFKSGSVNRTWLLLSVDYVSLLVHFNSLRMKYLSFTWWKYSITSWYI